jgi:hypothetical protein
LNLTMLSSMLYNVGDCLQFPIWALRLSINRLIRPSGSGLSLSRSFSSISAGHVIATCLKMNLNRSRPESKSCQVSSPSNAPAWANDDNTHQKI